MELAEKRYAQWLAQQGLEPELRQELDAMHSDAEKVTDAFYRDLEFGTAGLRGVLGAGTNRMNIYVIRRATQAVAQYLNETELPKTVAIGHDSRIKSDVFAREAAAVLRRQRHHGVPLSPARACPGAELRRASSALRARRLRHGQPQPGGIQRLQGLRLRRLSDDAGGGKARGRAAGAHGLFHQRKDDGL